MILFLNLLEYQLQSLERDLLQEAKVLIYDQSKYQILKFQSNDYFKYHLEVKNEKYAKEKAIQIIRFLQQLI